jgi:hypothetical protein
MSLVHLEPSPERRADRSLSGSLLSSSGDVRP